MVIDYNVNNIMSLFGKRGKWESNSNIFPDLVWVAVALMEYQPCG
jgi:hypothetical protein